MWMLPLFCITSQLQRPVKFFLTVEYICFGYLKCSLTSGLSNAPTLDVIRCVETILKHFSRFFNNRLKFRKNPNSPFNFVSLIFVRYQMPRQPVVAGMNPGGGAHCATHYGQYWGKMKDAGRTDEFMGSTLDQNEQAKK